MINSDIQYTHQTSVPLVTFITSAAHTMTGTHMTAHVVLTKGAAGSFHCCHSIFDQPEMAMEQLPLGRITFKKKKKEARTTD